jgi:hypothetical protein
MTARSAMVSAALAFGGRIDTVLQILAVLNLVFVDGEDGAKISGVPEETGTFTFTVGVSCFSTMVVGQTAEKEYVIVVE